MGERRRVRLRRIGGVQVVRIPAGFELPGDEAIMHRDGDRLVVREVERMLAEHFLDDCARVSVTNGEVGEGA